MPGEPRHVLFIVSTFHSHGVNQPIKCVSLDREHVRQMEIERLRAERQSDFERIDSMTPDLDELLSMTIEPPREWLDER